MHNFNVLCTCMYHHNMCHRMESCIQDEKMYEDFDRLTAVTLTACNRAESRSPDFRCHTFDRACPTQQGNACGNIKDFDFNQTNGHDALGVGQGDQRDPNMSKQALPDDGLDKVIKYLAKRDGIDKVRFWFM